MTYVRPSPEEVRANQRLARRLPSRFTVPVVGVTFREGYPNNIIFLDDLVGDLRRAMADPAAARTHLLAEHAEVVERALVEGAVPVELRREHDNAVDPLAVAVWVPLVAEIGSIGFVPATTHGCLAPLLAEDLDLGAAWEGEIPLDGVRIDRDHPEHPGIRVTLYRVAPAPRWDDLDPVPEGERWR